MLPSAVAQNSALTVPVTIHDDDDDEIVETSDVEEQEEQRAASSSYWWSQSPQKRFRHSDLPLSPRKRVKLNYRPAPASARMATPDCSQSGTVPRSSSPVGSKSPISSSLAHTPTLSDERGRAWHMVQDVYETDREVLEASPIYTTGVTQSHDDCHSPTFPKEDQHSTIDSSPAVTQANSSAPRLRSPSVDPLGLWTSLPTTPRPHSPLLPLPVASVLDDPLDLLRQTPQDAPSLHIHSSPSHSSLGLFTPKDRQNSLPPSRNVGSEIFVTPHKTMSLPSSPLTPLSPRRNDIVSPTPAPPWPPDQRHNIDEHELNNQSGYSLRRRQAKQLKPYAFDALMYQRQMRSNPDALIKVVLTSPRRHHQHDNEYETQEPDRMVDAEECATLERRRKGKMRNQSDTQSRSQGVILDNAHRGQSTERAYPKILEDLPTTDEEEAQETLELKQEARRIAREKRDKEKAVAKQKKARSFPLSKSFLSNERDTKRSSTGSSRRLSSPHKNNTSDVSDAEISAERREAIDAAGQVRRAATPRFSRTHSLPEPSEDYHGYDQSRYPDGNESDTEDIQRNTRDTAIIIDDDGDNDNDDNSPSRPYSLAHHSSNSSPSSTPDLAYLNSKDAKRLKAARRMMPGVMLLKELQNAQDKSRFKRPRLMTLDSDEEVEESPLLPGQSRTMTAVRPRHIKDIRGDSESSDDERATVLSLSHDNSDVDEGGLRRETRPISSVISISDSEEASSSSSDDAVGDDEIQAQVRENGAVVANKRLREGSLIDYMLSRSTIIGGQTRKRKTQCRNDGSKRHVRQTRTPKYGVDIVTRGARKHGTHRQTLLPFEKQAKPRKISARRNPSGGSSTHRQLEEDGNTERSEMEQVLGIFGEQDLKAVKYRLREKRRRQRAKAQGVFVFHSTGSHISTGRRKPRVVTIDIEDEGFRTALAPLSQDWVKSTDRPLPQTTASHAHSPSRRKVRPARPPEDIDTPQTVPDTRYRDIDSETPIISGMAFLPSTYIGMGRLRELIEIITPSKLPAAAGFVSTAVTTPLAYAAQGLDIGPQLSLAEFAASLGTMCDQLFYFMTGLPEDDYPEKCKHWEGLIRASCQLISWFLSCSSEDDCATLRATGTDHVTRLVTRLRDLKLEGSSMDTMTLAGGWFTVEVLIRLGYRLPDSGVKLSSDSSPLVNSVNLVVAHLLEFGLEQIMDSVRAHVDGLTSLSSAERAAEVWVCLIHLLMPRGGQTSRVIDAHPLWQIVLDTMQRNDRPEQSNLEASEGTWQTIFGLCGLSQFSDLGMSVSEVRLPSSWDMVAFALRQIRLVSHPESEHHLSASSLDKRDQYIGIVTSRCFHLWSRWHWKLDDASVMFNQLVEIFRSRKFGNLRQERPDFAGFMRYSDWNLHSRHENTDTAFDLFLKLIVQAANSESVANDASQRPRTLSSKTKKLLSLAIPVGSVPFTRDAPLGERSMLYNRFSAIAVAVCLDPSNVRSRLIQARGYVDFKDADDSTRIACIRGMMYFACLMIPRKIPLEEVWNWLTDMVNSLVDEYKAATVAAIREHMAKDPHLSLDTSLVAETLTKDRLVLMVQVLLRAVRTIIGKYKEWGYPDPALISRVIDLFLRARIDTGTRTGRELGRLIRSFLNVRAIALPSPPRPLLQTDAKQESQDEYGTLDLNWDDPDLNAVLDAETPGASEQRAKDSVLSEVIDSRLYPLVFRSVSKCFRKPPETKALKELTEDTHLWIDCWLGCANVVIQNGKKTWSSYLDLHPWEQIDDGCWRRRVELKSMLVLLQLSPMLYTTYPDRFMDILLESMAADRITLEHEYVSLLFSLDGLRHPLLRTIPLAPPPEGDDYKISEAELTACRTSFLDVMFDNLEESLTEEARGSTSLAEDNSKYIGFFIKMLSAMRSIYEGLEDGSDGRKTYCTFCRGVLEVMQKHESVRSQARLSYWINWGRHLN